MACIALLAAETFWCITVLVGLLLRQIDIKPTVRSAQCTVYSAADLEWVTWKCPRKSNDFVNSHVDYQVF